MARKTRLKREGKLIGILFASVSSIVGSGWLLGPLHASQLAGTMSLISWVIGAVIIGLIALVFSEISTMYPKSGALVHMSFLGHGRLFGGIWTWLIILSFLPVVPGEVLAVISYASNYIPALTHGDGNLLTGIGLLVSVGLLAVLMCLNLLAIKMVLSINSALTWWKLLVPVATIVLLLNISYHPDNLSAGGGTVAGIFTALPSAGIIYSYLGARQAIDLAGEAKNPEKTIPMAVIGSIALVLFLYLGLQVAFLLGVQPGDLGNGGWSSLSFNNMGGPFAEIALTAGALWWAIILYVDAVISPGGAGFIWATTAGRTVMGAGEMHVAPQSFAKLNNVGSPWVAFIVIFVLGVIFLFPFPSWQKIINYISASFVLAMSIGPIILLHLRRSLPTKKRPFLLRGAWLIAPVAFIFCNWIIIWSGLYTVIFLLGLLTAITIIYSITYFIRNKASSISEIRHILWVLPYFLGLIGLDAIGPGDSLGGYNIVSFGAVMIISGLFSLVILWLALKSVISKEETSRISNYISNEVQS